MATSNFAVIVVDTEYLPNMSECHEIEENFETLKEVGTCI